MCNNLCLTLPEPGRAGGCVTCLPVQQSHGPRLGCMLVGAGWVVPEVCCRLPAISMLHCYEMWALDFWTCHGS